MKSNKGLKTGIVVLVLLLAIGFAAVTTQLFINGTIRIGANETDFEQNVIFYNPSATGAADSNVTGDTAASATIADAGKSITFETQILDVIGETATATFYVKNDSQYAATLGHMTCNFGNSYNENTAAGTKSNDYVTVTANDELYNVTIQPNGVSSTTGSVTVRLDKSYAPSGGSTSTSYTFTCRMTATASEPTP